MQFEPIAIDTHFGDTEAGGQSAAVIPSFAVSGQQCRYESIGQTSVRLLKCLGHGNDYGAAGQRIALTAIIATGHGRPVAAAFRCGRRVVQRSTAVHVDDAQLPLLRLRIVGEQLHQHGFRSRTCGQTV